MSPHRKQLTRDSIGFAFTQYLVRAMNMARSFIAARLLGPMEFGAWNALQLMIDYGTFAPVGTQQGLDQLVPGRLVAGDHESTVRLKRAALFNILLFSALFMLGCVLWATWGSSRIRETWHLKGIAIALLCVLFTNIANYGTSILRSHGNIGAVSGWFVWQGLIGTGVGLALIVWFGRWGLLWGLFVGGLVALLWVLREGRGVLPLRPAPAAEGLDLVQTGFPLFVYNSSALVMRSIDRLVVLRFLGTKELGYYSLSVNVLTLLMSLPDSVAYVAYPRLLRQFSESGDDPASIRDRAERLVRALTLLLPALSGVGYLWSRDLVLWLLPKFAPGVDAMRVLCFGATGLAIATLASIILMTVRRRLVLMPAALFLTAVSAALEIVAIRLHGGLVGVAWATLLAYVLNGAVLLSLAATGMGMAFREMLALVVRAVVPLALALLVAKGADVLLLHPPAATGPERALHLALATVVFGAAYGLLVAPFARGVGLRQLALAFNVPVLAGLLRRFGGGADDPENRS